MLGNFCLSLFPLCALTLYLYFLCLSSFIMHDISHWICSIYPYMMKFCFCIFIIIFYIMYYIDYSLIIVVVGCYILKKIIVANICYCILLLLLLTTCDCASILMTMHGIGCEWIRSKEFLYWEYDYDGCFFWDNDESCTVWCLNRMLFVVICAHNNVPVFFV